MRRLIAIIAIVVVSCTFLSADVYIKQNHHTDAVTMMGQTQPAKDQVQEIWVAKNKMATHTGDASMLLDLDKKVMYMVNHGKKSYIEMSIPVDIAKYMPEQMQGMIDSMMGSLKVTVTNSNETKTIKTWKCSGYTVKMEMSMMGMPMVMNMKVWASTTVPFDWEGVMKMMMDNMMKAQMRLSDEAVKEMKKVKGYWIEMEMSMNMMGADVKSTTSVLEIAEKPADPKVYAVPEGYTKKDKMSMADMNR
jgi:hypothetical protein